MLYLKLVHSFNIWNESNVLHVCYQLKYVLIYYVLNHRLLYSKDTLSIIYFIFFTHFQAKQPCVWANEAHSKAFSNHCRAWLNYCRAHQVSSNQVGKCPNRTQRTVDDCWQNEWPSVRPGNEHMRECSNRSCRLGLLGQLGSGGKPKKRQKF